jgi:prepilin signal peptidase PulO-like enzyme (type II secretory pathway)
MITPEVLMAFWLFVLGAVFGSFLNVVIYRLPAGMSLVRPPSHCPACGHPIRWFDNLPVFGWFVLWGRCRDCRAPISLRYPLVEAAAGALFVLMGWCECLAAGMNLPPRVILAVTGELATVARPLPQLYGIWACHMLLLMTLLAAAAIEFDRKRPPAGLFLPAVLVGLAAPAVWPWLHPMPAWPMQAGLLVGILDSMIGLAAGTFLGWMATRAGCVPYTPKEKGDCPRPTSGRCPPERPVGGHHARMVVAQMGTVPFFRAAAPGVPTVLAAACVGAVLGWQAAAVAISATLAANWLLRALRRFLPGLGRISPTAVLFLTTLGWILAWAQLVRWAGAL